MIRFLFLFLFSLSAHAVDFSIPEDIKKYPAFVGVCNDPACNYKTPPLSFRNAAYMVRKEYGVEYAILVALTIGIGDQMLRGSFDSGDAAAIAVSKFLYYRYEF